ncbi:putative wall-associated receptor kinase-like 16 isoform X3 [Rosa chinensis]|uniref:putative wall-associated receptor kinase-like 16 isoform X3 n=1 Tax=Rosa chinensis TaxID=74649 RepID=UPI001AD8F5E6|nr:putative wall-associated receptor kinase-like 16 isoform X3 [Rosa chinensis]
MIYCWFSLAASILFLFTANALSANSSLRIPFPFDVKRAKEFYLSDGVDFRQSNNNATNINFCFEKALSLAGFGYWCSIQGDAYGNEYGYGFGLYAYAYNYETKTLHPTDVCQGCYFFLSLLLYVLLGIYSSVKKNIFIHLKFKLFKKNGGLLLEQHIANSHGPGAGCTKIFTAEELVMEIIFAQEKVLVEEGQIECFINEIITLAHINHQNVIKFLGCCLETEAPILVYEFTSNGTLFDYIHDWKNGKVSMPHWDILMEIASESAAGLAYLHSSSIIHGNVKSSNILLTDCLAKVAGFGPPSLVPSNESQISTLVQRTLGYLDPEYFVTGQLTDKSDVYSFGVVLVEILTGEKPISFNRPENQRIITCLFLLSMDQQNSLFQILAPQVKEENKEQVRAVAELAKQCLKLSSAERPTMEEVAGELKRLSLLSDTYLTVHVS